MTKPIKILTKSAEETKKIGERMAKEMLKSSYAKISEDKTATVLSLEGELGAGKTTFTQGFAKGLGIKENPRSPTFVLMRAYSAKRTAYRNFIHIDAYRINAKDLKALGWRDLIKNQENIILIEWGDRVKNILPKKTARIIFEHEKRENRRLIKIK